MFGGPLPFLNSIWRENMYPDPSIHSVTLRSGRSGWHINSQTPRDLTSCSMALFASAERRRTKMYAWCSYLFRPMPRPTGYPLHKACAREEETWIELPELWSSCQPVPGGSSALVVFGWSWVGGAGSASECYRVACTFCTAQDKFIYCCLQLRAATWHSLIPLVISQAQWFLFLLTCFTAGGIAADLDLLFLAQMT